MLIGLNTLPTFTFGAQLDDIHHRSETTWDLRNGSKVGE